AAEPGGGVVPRGDCSAHRGCPSAGARDRPGGDHHPARRFAKEQEYVAGKRAAKAPPRFDRSADDDQLRPPLGGDAGDVLPEASGAGADALLPPAAPVGRGHCGRGLEPLSEALELAVEVRVQRQLAIDKCGATRMTLAPRSAATRQARSTAFSVSSRSSSGTT